MQMLATNTAVTLVPHFQEDAVLDIVDFIRAEGPTIVELFDTLGDEDAADAALELIGRCSDQLPDPGPISGLLGDIHLALETVSFFELENLVETFKARCDIINAHRWIGARIADLDRRLLAA